jgi:uncharacterized protein YggE
MNVARIVAVFAAFAGGLFSAAQQTSQVELKIEPSNRTLTVSAEARVTAEPEVAILHIGFETQPSDAKAAYAAGAKLSNEIVSAIKQAGIAESAVRSESQSLEPWEGRNHKFKLRQNWVVKVPPERAAEILDNAVSAGATDSGQIEWTVNDEKALDDQALEKAAARARADAAVLANGMGAHLGVLVYVTNHIAKEENVGIYGYADKNIAGGLWSPQRAPAPPLAIEPHKVSRAAGVYAVFAIE